MPSIWRQRSFLPGLAGGKSFLPGMMPANGSRLRNKPLTLRQQVAGSHCDALASVAVVKGNNPFRCRPPSLPFAAFLSLPPSSLSLMHTSSTPVISGSALTTSHRLHRIPHLCLTHSHCSISRSASHVSPSLVTTSRGHANPTASQTARHGTQCPATRRVQQQVRTALASVYGFGTMH